MPKKKQFIIIIISIVVIISAFVIISNLGLKNSTTKLTVNEIKLIDVDDIARNPAKYSGIINVEGKVKEVSDKKNLFSLGCEDDEDANIPVLYNGVLPGQESNIIVTGELKKDADGKFFFEAREFKYK